VWRISAIMTERALLIKRGFGRAAASRAPTPEALAEEHVHSYPAAALITLLHHCYTTEMWL